MNSTYQEMWTAAYPKIKAGLIVPDNQMDKKADDRRGMTLLIRPSPQIIDAMEQFLRVTFPFAPNQYYYPSTDLHLTTLSIFSCKAGFDLNKVDLAAYQKVIQQTLNDFAPFPIHYTGITLSTTGIVAKGYDPTGTLNEIRAALRTAFKGTILAHTIDQRYVLKVAHSTLIRFKNPLLQPQLFTDFLESQQTIPFGAMTVNAIDLVFNDWYMKQEKVRLLERYQLSYLEK